MSLEAVLAATTFIEDGTGCWVVRNGAGVRWGFPSTCGQWYPMKGGARFQVAGTETLRARFNLVLFLLSICFPFPRTRNLDLEVENAKASGHVWSLGSYQMQTDVQALSDTLLVQVAVIVSLILLRCSFGPKFPWSHSQSFTPNICCPFPIVDLYHKASRTCMDSWRVFWGELWLVDIRVLGSFSCITWVSANSGHQNPTKVWSWGPGRLPRGGGLISSAGM